MPTPQQKRLGILTCNDCHTTVPSYNPEPESWPMHRCASDGVVKPFSKFRLNPSKPARPRQF